MRTNLAIADDFFDDPDAIRIQALAGTFAQASGEGFTGGYRTPGDFDLRPTLDGIARMLGADIRYDPTLPFQFRILTRKQDARPHSIVHYDPPLWVAFVSLSPSPPKPAFTRFYRHRATGLYGLHDGDAVRRYLRSSGLSLAELGDRLERDSRDVRKWDEVGAVAHLYNRLFVMRGRQFHQAAPGAGATPATAKLTLLVTFEIAGAEQRATRSRANALRSRAPR